MFHKVIRWGLGVHGVIHIAEMCMNIYEQAWASALLTAISGFLMISGAIIDYDHHKNHNE